MTLDPSNKNSWQITTMNIKKSSSYGYGNLSDSWNGLHCKNCLHFDEFVRICMSHCLRIITSDSADKLLSQSIANKHKMLLILALSFEKLRSLSVCRMK